MLITGYRLHQLNLQNTTDSLFISVSQAGSQMLEGLEVKWSQNGVEHTQEFPDFSLSSGGQENIFWAPFLWLRVLIISVSILKAKTMRNQTTPTITLNCLQKVDAKEISLCSWNIQPSFPHSFSPAAIYSAEKF